MSPRVFALWALIFSSAGLAIAGLRPLPQDTGAAGTWQKLLKLKTTASVMHTTAHPDDEHGGLLAWLSRGQGARVSLLTLNRGEAGDNAIGSELFDALGLIRTEELLDADAYYGVDEQYFTTVIDYGFSKRLDEALEKWGRENVLRDVVRVIRMERPLVIVSRFQGTDRDGHGNHQTAGLITQQTFRAAADPNTFPEQLAGGLRPWQAKKLYIGGARESEEWTVRIDTGDYSPWLGDSYQSFSRIGLSFQRSQNSGRLSTTPGPSFSYYKRVDSVVNAPAREATFFDGLDTRLQGLFAVLGVTPPPGAGGRLTEIDQTVGRAVAAFTVSDPSAVVPALARGLALTRELARQVGVDADAAHMLRVKEHQFVDAIATALGIEFTAVAAPSGTADQSANPFAQPPVMGPVVPDQRFSVLLTLTNRGRTDVTPTGVTVAGEGTAAVMSLTPARAPLKRNESLAGSVTIVVPRGATVARPYFHRATIAESRYTIDEPRFLHRPARDPAFVATATFEIDGVPIEIRRPVERREAQLPYGYVMRELVVLPSLALNLDPAMAIVPIAAAKKMVTLTATVLNNREGDVAGMLALQLPDGWTAQPPAQAFRFTRAGEQRVLPFTVAIPALEGRDYRVEAVATVDGREYRDGYDVIDHRDLETRYLFRRAESTVRGIAVTMPTPLTVGYVMGIGDEVPSGVAQLGASVQLLEARDLARGDLSRFDAIMTGTRAYAVREDLRTYNQRLLEYVERGGNLIVLYNTQEFVPGTFAPFPAELPARAEEVSEEDSPVDILEPTHLLLTTPNAITRADFDGWVEQRGSKFFSAWDTRYVALIATHDRGQAPQRGGWVHARYGKGHYTYFAYAFHRQLPYGVPGAYRLLANLLALGRSASPR